MFLRKIVHRFALPPEDNRTSLVEKLFSFPAPVRFVPQDFSLSLEFVSWSVSVSFTLMPEPRGNFPVFSPPPSDLYALGGFLFLTVALMETGFPLLSSSSVFLLFYPPFPATFPPTNRSHFRPHCQALRIKLIPFPFFPSPWGLETTVPPKPTFPFSRPCFG